MYSTNYKKEHLETLCYQRAQTIYGSQLPEEVRDRLQFELEIIEKSGNSNQMAYLKANYPEEFSAVINESE